MLPYSAGSIPYSIISHYLESLVLDFILSRILNLTHATIARLHFGEILDPVRHRLFAAGALSYLGHDDHKAANSCDGVFAQSKGKTREPTKQEKVPGNKILYVHCVILILAAMTY